MLASFNCRRRIKAESRQIPQNLAARLKFVCWTPYVCARRQNNKMWLFTQKGLTYTATITLATSWYFLGRDKIIVTCLTIFVDIVWKGISCVSNYTEKEESVRGDISSSNIGQTIKENSFFSPGDQCALKPRLTLCSDFISFYIRTAPQQLKKHLTCLHEIRFFCREVLKRKLWWITSNNISEQCDANSIWPR